MLAGCPGWFLGLPDRIFQNIPVWCLFYLDGQQIIMYNISVDLFLLV